MKYYVTHNNEQSGPFEDEELRQRVLSGEFQRKDFCWKEGMEDWKPIESVIELPPSSPRPVVTDAKADDLDDDNTKQVESAKGTWPIELKVALTVVALIIVIFVGIPNARWAAVILPTFFISAMWREC